MPSGARDLIIKMGEIIDLLPNLDLMELDEVLGMAKARAMYRDSSQPERNCDHCEQPYRGPAVFCCLRCTLAAR